MRGRGGCDEQREHEQRARDLTRLRDRKPEDEEESRQGDEKTENETMISPPHGRPTVPQNGLRTTWGMVRFRRFSGTKVISCRLPVSGTAARVLAL